MAAMGLRSKLGKHTRRGHKILKGHCLGCHKLPHCSWHTTNLSPSTCSSVWWSWCRTCRSRWTRSTSLRRGSPSPGWVGWLTSAQRVAVSLSHCFAEQASCRPGPKLPRPGRPTLRKRSHNKEARVRPPPPQPHHSKAEAAPRGPWVGARAPVVPGVQELRPCCLQSRKLCTLCGRNLHSHFFCS